MAIRAFAIALLVPLATTFKAGVAATPCVVATVPVLSRAMHCATVVFAREQWVAVRLVL